MVLRSLANVLCCRPRDVLHVAHTSKFQNAYRIDIVKRLQDPHTHRLYRCLSIFGAGAGINLDSQFTHRTLTSFVTGLPAALGILCGVYEASIEANEWICYPCVDGVSAGALIACFLAHTNCLNPHEVVNEVLVMFVHVQMFTRSRLRG